MRARLRAHRKAGSELQRPAPLRRGSPPTSVLRQPLQCGAERRAEPAATCGVARKAGKLPILMREVNERVEGSRAREQARMPREEKQRLLASHAAAEGINAPSIDPEPWQRLRYDVGHPCQVIDLSGRSPRVRAEALSLAIRVHDGERAQGRQVTPKPWRSRVQSCRAHGAR